MTDVERLAAAAARGKSPSKRGGGETLLFSCLVVLVSLFVVVDDAKSSLLAINNGIPSSSLSSSSKTTTNNNNNNHKYAFTPTNGKIRYSWVAKGHALPSERSGAKSDGAGSKEERDADEESSSSSSFFSSEFKYMHMAMPTILPDGSIAVGAFVRYFCFSLSMCVFSFVLSRERLSLSSSRVCSFARAARSDVYIFFLFPRARRDNDSVSSVADGIRRIYPAGVVLGDIERRW
jgi:hypothetical protein